MQAINDDYGLKRFHERKQYGADIFFSHQNKAYRGILKNISLGGAFIQTNNVNLFEHGELVTVSIPYTSGKKHVKRLGRILWKNNEGFAIEFTE